MERDGVFVPDRISNLPLDVLEHILVCLPIRDAVKTSILSTKWKNLWTTIPQLVFDDSCIPTSSTDAQVCRSEFVNFVDQLLFLHQGPVHIFKVSTSYLEDDEADEWMQYLPPKDLKEFSIVRNDYEFYVSEPSRLISYQYLTHLELFGFDAISLAMFGCFTHLKTLILEPVFFGNVMTQSLLSKCPHLESLTLTYKCFEPLNICASNLKHLSVEGCFEDLRLQHTPLLSTLNVYLQWDEDVLDHLKQTTSCNMIGVIGGTPVLQRLVAQSCFVMYLSKNIPNSFPAKCDRLKELELYQVDFHDVDQISVAICLIANSPNLEVFICSSCSVLKSCRELDLNYWKTQHSLYCSFQQLQFVTMEDISGFPNELEFILFFLFKRSVLENMTIKPSDRVLDEGWDLLLEMLPKLGYASVTSPKRFNTDGSRFYARTEIIFDAAESEISDDETPMRSENPHQ